MGVAIASAIISAVVGAAGIASSKHTADKQMKEQKKAAAQTRLARQKELEEQRQIDAAQQTAASQAAKMEEEEADIQLGALEVGNRASSKRKVQDASPGAAPSTGLRVG